MNRGILTLSLALFAASATPPAVAAPTPTIDQAVAATTSRSETNLALDASRKPAEVLRFLGLKRGMHVLDAVGGNGYWAEITSQAVGPRGRVTIWQPTQFYTQKTYDAFNAGLAKAGNVGLISSPWQAPDLPAAKYDFALINLDYHDVYWSSTARNIPRQDPGPWIAAVAASLKPGAVIGIIDHSARAGSDPRESVEKYHRIDPAVVKADWEKAGFTLEATSDILRNPADPLDVLVFDKAIRGKTDRFIYRFRKAR